MMKKWMMLMQVATLSAVMLFVAACGEDAEAQETPKQDTTAQAAKESTPSADTVAVTVNGQKIMASTISKELDKSLAAMKKSMPAGQELPEAQLKQFHMQLTDSLVQQALIEQMAKEAKVTVTDDQVTEQLKEIAEERNQTMEEVKAEITSMGMTLDDIKAQLHTKMLANELVEKTTVSDEEKHKFYDDNPQYFDRPEQVRASHILIKFPTNATDEDKAAAKEKIEGLLKRAKAGEDFAELAKEYTEDPGSKETGGEYTFPRGQMVKPFEDTAFSLEVGQISDPVETQYGYHIIKLSEKLPAGKVPFADEEEKITNYLKGQKFQESQKAFQAKAEITYSDEEKALRDEVQALMQQQQQAQMMQQMLRQQQQQQAQQQTEQAQENAAAPSDEKPAEE